LKSFNLERYSSLPQEKIFQISTDVENFHKIMPEYFKSLEIIEENDHGKIVLEKIKFLGILLKIKTKHVVLNPNIHEIHILSGFTKGTKFMETYVKTDNGTVVSIDVKLVLNGFLKYFGFLENFIENKMSSTMDKFIASVEKFDSSHSSYSG